MNLVLVRIWNKDNNNDKRRIPAHLLAYLPTLIVKELKISVEPCRVVTTLNIIFSVVFPIPIGYMMLSSFGGGGFFFIFFIL